MSWFFPTTKIERADSAVLFANCDFCGDESRIEVEVCYREGVPVLKYGGNVRHKKGCAASPDAQRVTTAGLR